MDKNVNLEILENNLNKESKNIIIWYPFKKLSKILQVGLSNIDITRFLLKNNIVTLIVFSENEKKLAESLENENLIIILCNGLNELKLDKIYDYSLFIDYNNKIDINEFIVLSNKIIKEDGKILFAINNKLGVKNICGNFSEYEENLYDTLLNKSNLLNNYTKKEISIILKNYNMNFKFYYPFPDYKHANVIYSDKYLPTCNSSKINYNPIYDEKSIITLNENALLKELTKENLIEEFSNSFFIETWKNENIETPINYVSFNNMRKIKYKAIVMFDNEYVYKKPYADYSKEHFKNLVDTSKILKSLDLNVLETIDNNIIKMDYIDNKYLLDNLLSKLIQANKIKEFYKLLDGWIEKCLNKIPLVKNETNKIYKLEINDCDLSNLNYLKIGIIDFVFENVFYKDEKFFIFDQEWNFENIPKEFVLYRAISNLFIHNHNINKIISLNEILIKYDLLKYKEVFDKVESIIQNEIISEKFREKYCVSEKKIVNLQKEIQEKKELYEYKKLEEENKSNLQILLEEKTKKLEEAQKNINELNEFKISVLNSKTWKLRNRLRKIIPLKRGLEKK